MFEPAANATVANRYRLVREIGRGGMGSVWEALDLELDAPCALKFILNQRAKSLEVRSRFLREARSVARLPSPHAVSIRSAGEWEEALYIAMELLVGETLLQRLRRAGPLSSSDTCRIVDQVASVLTVAHRTGIVHRDLKPENLWLWSGPSVFVKLLDFGVAKHVLERGSLLRTATGILVGTPYYMSPEQAAGDRQVDHRSDLWSLAVIAAECLSGRRTFHGKGLGQVLSSIMHGDVPPMVQLYPKATPELQRWWVRATAKEASQRYASARELAHDLAVGLELRSEPFVPDPEDDGVPSLGRTPEYREVEPDELGTSSLMPVSAGPVPTPPLELTTNPWQTSIGQMNDASAKSNLAGGRARSAPAPARSTQVNRRSRQAILIASTLLALTTMVGSVWFLSTTHRAARPPLLDRSATAVSSLPLTPTGPTSGRQAPLLKPTSAPPPPKRSVESPTQLPTPALNPQPLAQNETLRSPASSELLKTAKRSPSVDSSERGLVPALGERSNAVQPQATVTVSRPSSSPSSSVAPARDDSKLSSGVSNKQNRRPNAAAFPEAPPAPGRPGHAQPSKPSLNERIGF